MESVLVWCVFIKYNLKIENESEIITIMSNNNNEKLERKSICIFVNGRRGKRLKQKAFLF